MLPIVVPLALFLTSSAPFQENVGQRPPDVAFHAPTAAGEVLVARDGAVHWVLPREDGGGGVVLRESVVDGRDVRPIGAGRSAARIHRFHGGDAGAWRVDVPTYPRVLLPGVREGFDVELVVRPAGVEKIVHGVPGARWTALSFRVEGAETLRVDRAGRLVATTPLGPVAFTRPVAFQVGDDGPESIAVRYRVDGDRYGFDVGAHDPTRPVVVDPLLGATYLGGAQNDRAYAVETSGGELWVAGSTQSANFPVTPGAYDSTQVAYEAFVARYDAETTTLLSATYLGGLGDEDAYALEVTDDAVWVAGRTTSGGFPTTPGAYQTAYAGGTYDVFVVRLSKDLGTLVAGTLLGGAGTDWGLDLAVTATDVIVAGTTTSPGFPVTPGAYDGSLAGVDAFVAVLSTDLATLKAATYLGGSLGEYETSLATDGASVWLTGETNSTDFPTGPGAYDTVRTGSDDVFVARLPLALTSLTGGTYLGGSTSATSNEEESHDIVFHGGDVWLTGWTYCGNFPTTSGAFDTSHNSDDYEDAWVTRLSGDLGTLVASTFVGGDDEDVGEALDVTANGVWVVGSTASTDFPTTPGAFAEDPAGNEDGFVTHLSPSLATLAASTHYGGAYDDALYAVTVDGDRVVAAGSTRSADLSLPPDAADPTVNNGTAATDALVLVLSDDLGGPWTDLGFGLAGTLGVPTLDASGTLLLGDPVTLAWSGALPNRTAYVVLGVARVDVFPFFGGTLVPAFQPPLGLFLALGTDAAGGLTLAGPWPPGVPSGTTLYVQAWFDDPGAAFTLAASNAMEGIVP